VYRRRKQDRNIRGPNVPTEQQMSNTQMSVVQPPGLVGQCQGGIPPGCTGRRPFHSETSKLTVFPGIPDGVVGLALLGQDPVGQLFRVRDLAGVYVFVGRVLPAAASRRHIL